MTAPQQIAADYLSIVDVPGLYLVDWGPVWVVLGVSRLHYTLATGRITSKTGAGRYARETFGPEFLRIRRAEPGPSRYRSRLARRRDTLAFLDHVISDALA